MDDGIGVDEDGDGKVDTYLKNNRQTEVYIAGCQEDRYEDYDEEFDPERNKVGYVYKNGTHRYTDSRHQEVEAPQDIEIEAIPRRAGATPRRI